MSTCISRHGEYSSHTTDDRFICQRCGLFDEDAALTEIEKLWDVAEAAEALTGEPGEPGWRTLHSALDAWHAGGGQ